MKFDYKMIQINEDFIKKMSDEFILELAHLTRTPTRTINRVFGFIFPRIYERKKKNSEKK